jgi:hypothetical protein
MNWSYTSFPFRRFTNWKQVCWTLESLLKPVQVSIQTLHELEARLFAIPEQPEEFPFRRFTNWKQGLTNESIALTVFYTPFSEGGLNYLRQIKIILNKLDCQAPNPRSTRASEWVNERIRILAIALPPQMLMDCHKNINLSYTNTQRKGRTHLLPKRIWI